MSAAIEVRHLTKTYKNAKALDDVSLSLTGDSIYGLFGRNGAGKTTLMSILTAQNFASSGEVEIFGGRPYENARVLSRMCFVRESQKYPEDATATHALTNAGRFFPRWDQSLAEELIADFHLPMKTPIKKLSRGQQSAIGVIIGLASRAEITFFDEPYLGFDAVARQTFYDHLIADYAECPRTIVLSSHLIDEVADLIENVIVIDHGRIIIDEPTEEVRGRAVNIVGDVDAIRRLVAGREVIHRQSLGRVASVTFLGRLSALDRELIAEADLGVVSLQFTNSQTFVWVPMLVLGGVWLITLIVYWIISASGVDTPMYSGGSQAPLWYFAVVGAQAMNLTYYFSQAMSLTRREFYLGSLLAAAMSAVGISLVFVCLGLIEQATDGYGINGYFAYLPWVWEGGPLAAGFVYFVLTMLWFVLGFWFAIVKKRFGALILTLSLIVIAFVLLAGAAIISLDHAWPEVWMWLTQSDAIGLALWALGCTVLFAAGSYLTLRRLTS